MRDRAVKIDLGAFVIELDAHLGITLCRFDDRRVERSAPDRVDAFLGVDIIRRKMQRPEFIMNYPATHWDCMFQGLFSDPDLLQRMNTACRNREVDRASAHDVPFTRISTAFIKIDFMPTLSQIRREQSARQTATDKNKSCHSVRIYESGNQESRKSRQNGCNPAIYPTASDKDALQFFEGIPQVIQNVTGQQRLLTLAIVK